MRDKVELFVACNDGVGATDLAGLAQELAGHTRERLPAEAELMVAVRHPQDPTRELANAAAMASGSVIFDVVLVVAGPQGQLEQLTAAVAGLATAHDGIDAQRSAAAAGSEHVIVPGDEPLVHLFALRRLPGITTAEFHHHWLTIHSELGHKIPGIGAYNQFHCDPASSARAAQAIGVEGSDLDGVAETYCHDLEAFNTIMSSAEVAGEGLSDQREFIDAARSTAALYQIS
jgi:EthD domain